MKAIWAQSKNGVIGQMGKLPWSIPEELAHFKKTTSKDPLIMGRLTFESLPKVLPGRPHLVVGSSSIKHPDVRAFSSVEEAIEAAPDAWIIGGGRLLETALPFIDEILLTTVDLEIFGKEVVYAPALDFSEWEVSEIQSHSERGTSPAWKVQRVLRVDKRASA